MLFATLIPLILGVMYAVHLWKVSPLLSDSDVALLTLEENRSWQGLARCMGIDTAPPPPRTAGPHSALSKCGTAWAPHCTVFITVCLTKRIWVRTTDVVWLSQHSPLHFCYIQLRTPSWRKQNMHDTLRSVKKCYLWRPYGKIKSWKFMMTFIHFNGVITIFFHPKINYINIYWLFWLLIW